MTDGDTHTCLGIVCNVVDNATNPPRVLCVVSCLVVHAKIHSHSRNVERRHSKRIATRNE